MLATLTSHQGFKKLTSYAREELIEPIPEVAGTPFYAKYGKTYFRVIRSDATSSFGHNFGILYVVMEDRTHLDEIFEKLNGTGYVPFEPPLMPMPSP